MQDHAQALYNLSADLGRVLSQALTSELPISGSALGAGQVGQNALCGQFQYGLLYCALEKIEINQAADRTYWKDLHAQLTRIIDQEARASADKVLGPLGQWASQDEVVQIGRAAYDPLAPFAGTSLRNLEAGLKETPVAVLASRIIKSFYAVADHSAVADRVISLAFAGIKELFSKGGLA
ncbi:MAG: hypothetical protein C4525_00340 [Desulfarculus sp.]|nr:MAG: hypothetical protein C4525_00340 [Desulfarculus sp.]